MQEACAYEINYFDTTHGQYKSMYIIIFDKTQWKW